MGYVNKKKRRYWKQKLNEWLDSGLTGVDWCRENNESLDKLYYWKKKFLPGLGNFLAVQKRKSWREKLYQWLDSGLTGVDWCREHNESLDKLYYWKKKLSPAPRNTVKAIVLSSLSCHRLYLYSRPTNMRNGFERLSEAVTVNHYDDLMSGAHFAFVGRYREKIKVLYWEDHGMIVWEKRLDRGTVNLDNDIFSSSENGYFIQLI